MRQRCVNSVRSGGPLRFLPRDFRAPLSCLGEPDGNRLLAALDRTALAAFAGFQGSPFFAVHGALHALRRSLSIFCHFVLRIKINLECSGNFSRRALGKPRFATVSCRFRGRLTAPRPVHFKTGHVAIILECRGARLVTS